MKHSMLLIRPTPQSQDERNLKNIFQNMRQSDSLPSIHQQGQSQGRDTDRKSKMYDFVGSAEFKSKKFFGGVDLHNQTYRTNGSVENSLRNTTTVIGGGGKGVSGFKAVALRQKKQKQQAATQKHPYNTQSLNDTGFGFNGTNNFSKYANSTINRETILSKLSSDRHRSLTKQKRNIERYQQYKDYWNDQATKMKSLLKKKHGSVVEMSRPEVVVEDNPEKEQIINNYIVNYWEMSLRNHNPILKRHIKGNKYGEVELEEKLQMTEGTKQVEGSIPRLPVQRLRRLRYGDLAISGRSKAVRESQNCQQRSLNLDESHRGEELEGGDNANAGDLGNTAGAFTHRDMLKQEEVYKISYEGDKRWMGQENL